MAWANGRPGGTKKFFEDLASTLTGSTRNDYYYTPLETGKRPAERVWQPRREEKTEERTEEKMEEETTGLLNTSTTSSKDLETKTEGKLRKRLVRSRNSVVPMSTSALVVRLKDSP